MLEKYFGNSISFSILSIESNWSNQMAIWWFLLDYKRRRKILFWPSRKTISNDKCDSQKQTHAINWKAITYCLFEKILSKRRIKIHETINWLWWRKVNCITSKMTRNKMAKKMRRKKRKKNLKKISFSFHRIETCRVC